MERTGVERQIIEMEWEMFQNVKGVDGRASCQDDRETFVIMRLSQFESWPFEVVKSYHKDLEDARAAGRNLMMEKYAFMMKETDPEYFATIAHLLPAISETAERMAEEITERYLLWEKEVEILYPHVRQHGRPTDDTALDGTTSLKNYLYCELCTYSPDTLKLFLAKIMEAPHKNLYMISLEKMVQAYGYASLEAAETALS